MIYGVCILSAVTSISLTTQHLARNFLILVQNFQNNPLDPSRSNPHDLRRHRSRPRPSPLIRNHADHPQPPADPGQAAADRDDLAAVDHLSPPPQRPCGLRSTWSGLPFLTHAPCPRV